MTTNIGDRVLDVIATLEPSDQPTHVVVEARNISQDVVHVIDSPGLPYRYWDDGVLVVLHGVNPPPEDTDFYGVEIVETRPLAPGATLEFTASIRPLYIGDHYGAARTPVSPPRTVAISCRVGWGSIAIPAAESFLWSIERVLGWQQLAHAPDMQALVGS
jgi:hypothetical protein